MRPKRILYSIITLVSLLLTLFLSLHRYLSTDDKEVLPNELTAQTPVHFPESTRNLFLKIAVAIEESQTHEKQYNVFEFLTTIEEENPNYRDRLLRIQKKGSQIESLWLPIEKEKNALNAIAELEQISLPYNLISDQKVIEAKTLRDLARLHSAQANLLASQGNPSEAIKTLSRLFKITRTIQSDSENFIMLFTCIAMEQIINLPTTAILENESLSADSLLDLNDALSRRIDAFELLTRMLANEGRFFRNNILVMKDQTTGLFGWQKILPNATTNSLNEYYIEVLNLLQEDKFEEAKARKEKFENAFPFRNNLGHQIYASSVLSIQDFLKTIRKNEAELRNLRSFVKTKIEPVVSREKTNTSL